MNGALDGLRVVELAPDIAGPYCTHLLGALGAQVTKVEPPAGDPLRSWGPFSGGQPDPEGSGLFAYLNAGKQGVTLDLGSKHGVATAQALIGQADVVVDGYRPGTLDGLGLDLRGPRADGTALVVVQISDFGQAGPLRDVVATPFTMQAASGWLTPRDPRRPPVQVGARISEYFTGVYAALAALTALRIRRLTAEPVVLADVSTLECLISTLAYPMVMFEQMRRRGVDMTGHSGGGPVLGVVEAADGWVGVNCLTGQHYLDLCAMLGLSDYGARQMEVMAGFPARAEYYEKAQPWLSARTVDEIVTVCQAMRIPAAPVADGRTIFEVPQYTAREFWVERAEGDVGSFRQPGAPWRMQKGATALTSPAPRLGLSTLSSPVATNPYDDEPSDGATASLPFTGLKILDLTTFWAGGYVTCYLGALGADVVKVESVQRPDGFRFTAAFPGEEHWYERSGLWQSANLNKRDVTLDLASERGRALARRLAADADVVIENFSPRVVEQFGLDHADLATINPRVIVVRIPGFGLEGPWRDYVGWALNFEQTGGMAAVTGYADGPPCSLGGPADPLVGAHAAVALLGALEHRRRTGAGQLVELAQIEVAAHVTAEPVIQYSMNGIVEPRTGNRQRGVVQGLYPTATADDWVAICVRDDADWQALCAAMERADLREDHRFASARDREVAHDELDGVLTAWTCTESADSIVERLRARRVPAERLLTVDRMYEQDQLVARGYYEEIEHPITGATRHPGWPFRITPGPTHQHRWAAPTLGQHNDEILRGLGLSEGEIASLREARVIGERIAADER